MKDRAGTAGRRLRLITIDQAIAGSSNVLIAVLAARVLGVGSFGLFGIVFLVGIVALGVGRGLVCDPLLVHTEEAESRRGEVIGADIVLGLALGLVVLVGALGVYQWDPELGRALFVLAACVPFLALQDLARYLGFALRRPSAAIFLDTVWLALVFVGVAVLLATGTHSLTWFVAAWAGSGSLASLLLFVQHRGTSVEFTVAWLRYTWSFSWRYLISYMSTQVGALAVSSIVGGVAGKRALGGVQGTILLARPFGTFQTAAVAGGVSEISRSRGRATSVRRFAGRITTLTTVVALINSAIMLSLPDRVGRIVLGDTWDAAKPLLWAAAAQIVLLGTVTGARAGMLGLRLVHRTVVVDVAHTIGLLVAITVGVFINGALGALWGAALEHGIIATVWWTVFWRHTNGRCDEPDPAAVPAGVPAPEPPLAVREGEQSIWGYAERPPDDQDPLTGFEVRA